MNEVSKVAKEALCQIVNQPLAECGRAGGMLWLGFGEVISNIDRRGCQRMIHKYALHVQCPWRLIINNRILLGSGDMFLPKDGVYIDDFDWDIEGENLFDFKKDTLLKNFKTTMNVKKVQCRSNGSLNILFDSNNRFEVFPCNSVKGEFWRFIIFDRESSLHYTIFEEE